ncbi:MAG: DUF1566 domain-containing protein [Tannerellaceae bacterium]
MKQMFYTLAVLSALIFTGCDSGIHSENGLPVPSNDTIRIGINAKGIEQTGENQIEQIRIIAFRSDGTQYLNITKSKDELNTSELQHTYTTTVSVPKDQLTIYILANESNDIVNNVSDLHLSKTRFDEMYLTYLSDEIKAPFVMFGSHTISRTDMQQNSPQVDIDLKRTVSKVSLQLHCDYTDTQANLKNGTIDLRNTYIVNMPISPFLIENKEFLQADDFNTSASRKIEYEILDPAKGFTTKTIDFYISEHILSQSNYMQKNHTAIVVHGVYISESGQEVDIKYTIPLGDGIAKLTGGGTLEMLTKTDLNVTRNTHYQIIGEIKSTGEIDGISMVAKVAPWVDAEKVDIDKSAPYLNVSQIKLEMLPSQIKRVYFWSNQPLIYLDEKGTMQDGAKQDIIVTDFFENITGTNRSNFVVFDPDHGLNAFPGFVAYNGYFDLVLNPDITLKGGTNTFSFYLHAGKLTRTITLEINAPITVKSEDLSVVVAHHDANLDGTPRLGNTTEGVGKIHWWQALGIASAYEAELWLGATQAIYDIGCNNYAEQGAPQGTWRTPNLDELKLLQLEQDEILSQGGDDFDDTTSAYYWSASEVTDNPQQAYALNFGNGSSMLKDKNNYFFVRCIRK